MPESTQPNHNMFAKQGGEGGDPDHAEPGRDRRVREAVHGARRRQEGFRHRQRSRELSKGNFKVCFITIGSYLTQLASDPNCLVFPGGKNCHIDWLKLSRLQQEVYFSQRGFCHLLLFYPRSAFKHVHIY